LSTDFPRRHIHDTVETKASSYDKLNATLIAAIMLFGFLFSVLFLIWLTTVFDFSRRAAGPVVLANEPGDTKPKGVADDVLEPGVEEFPEVEVPQLANALEAVTDAVSSVRASLEKRSGDAAQMGRGSGYGSREGGTGTGGDGIPEHKRWIINYEAEDITSYAQQLSYFNIDIGVIHQTRNDIWRVNDAGGAAKVIQTDREKEKLTLRFAHKKQRMQRWDEELARRNGVNLSNTITNQFYPESTRQIIRQAEATALQAAGRELRQVRNTIFKVEAGGNGYVFTVVDILYR
jgi:hypothetical protein